MANVPSYCRNCGFPNSPVARFCAQCGFPQQAGPVAPQAAAAGPDLWGGFLGHLQKLATTDRLEGFSLKEMFSEVFKKRSDEEVEEYFVTGTAKATPPIEEVTSGWPKPWFFFRVLAFIAVIYAALLYAFMEFENPKLIPGLIMVGSFATPLASVILFFEFNSPRNVALYQVGMLVAMGGVASLGVSLIGYRVSELNWLGASQAGIIEEIGKLCAVALLVHQARYKYILNGVLFGAAVGAGFAAFESAGYAFEILLRGGISAMTTNMFVRGLLTPFGHVAWTAIAAGALWRVKGSNDISPKMFVNADFLKAFIIPVMLHMIWNSPLPAMFFLKFFALGFLAWVVVFGLVQQGLKQVRQEQKVTATQILVRHTQSGAAYPPGAPIPPPMPQGPGQYRW